MNRDKLRSRYRRFREWQKEPFHYSDEISEKHLCKNCGREFTGDHCYACGQKHNVGRITWSTVREGVMDIWGIGTRSLPYTLLQLLFRPGYLIRDYISGKRQVSFPPVKMLFIVVLCCYIISKWFLPNVLGLEPTTSLDTETYSMYDGTFKYLMQEYKAWGVLYMFSFMIIPVWVLFRYAPAYPRHTLPEGFYIQVFIGVLVPFFPILAILFPAIVDYLVVSYWVIYVYFVYKQLFGYGYWGTIWRFTMAYLSGFSFLFAVDCTISFFAEQILHVHTHRDSVYEFLMDYLQGVVLMLIGHVLNRYGMTIYKVCKGFFIRHTKR